MGICSTNILTSETILCFKHYEGIKKELQQLAGIIYIFYKGMKEGTLTIGCLNHLDKIQRNPLKTD
jgi:hypothetical protein